MSRADRTGRRFWPEMIASSEQVEAGFELHAPSVGVWRGAPVAGELVTGGAPIGEIEVLGQRFRLRAPPRVYGIVVGDDPTGGRARLAVEHGQRLVVLDPQAAGAALADAERSESEAEGEGGALVFSAPSSGRFYSRPAPDKPPFVIAGADLETGDTVCMLEVMKTFNRVAYGGEGLPERARVVRVVPRDESDLNAGDVILELEPV